MKKTFALIAMLVFALQDVFGDPTTFAEFQRLSSDERRALVHNENNPAHGSLVRWQWRMQLGESGWQQKELIRVIARNKYLNLDSLFEYYKLIRQEYVEQKLDGLSSGDLSPQNQETIKRMKSDFDVPENEYSDAIRIAASLIPSPEVKALDEKADALLGVWAKRCPVGQKWTLSDKQMNSITSDYQAFVSAMQKLPRLTDERVQDTIKLLPEDYPPRGFMY